MAFKVSHILTPSPLLTLSLPPCPPYTTLAFLQRFEHIKYLPAPGPLHTLFSSAGMLSRIFTEFNSNVTFSGLPCLSL